MSFAAPCPPLSQTTICSLKDWDQGFVIARSMWCLTYGQAQNPAAEMSSHSCGINFLRGFTPLSRNISNVNFYRYFNTLCTEMQISETVITKRPLLKWLMSSLDPIDSLKCFSRIVSIAPCHFGGCRSSRWWKNYRWKGLFGGYLCDVLTTDILIVYCRIYPLYFVFLIVRSHS